MCEQGCGMVRTGNLLRNLLPTCGIPTGALSVAKNLDFESTERMSGPRSGTVHGQDKALS